MLIIREKSKRMLCPVIAAVAPIAKYEQAPSNL